MTPEKKYNPEFKVSTFLPIAIILVLFFFASSFLGIRAGLVVMVLVFTGYSLYSMIAYLHTRNIGYLAAFAFQGFMALYFLTVPQGLMPIGSNQKAYFFYLCGFIFLVWLIYLMLSQKGKWKGRNVFELVAQNVDKKLEGYTSRPKPAGKMEYTKSELFGFVAFLRKNLIAMPYFEKGQIVFVPVKMGDEFPFIVGTAGDYHFYSWVSFDYNGNVSASLARKDYLAYNEEFSFDQLCDSFGTLFMEFLDYYKKDETERIMHRLRSVKVGIMS